ncbi:transglutaminase domain-containing protein [bacterium]|nr:transglutaminase domain-containing protein [bacterium]
MKIWQNFQRSKTISWYRALAFILIFITLFITIFIISQLDQGIHLNNLRQIVFLGFMFSLLLSLTAKPKPFLLILLSVSVGIIVIYANVGNLLQPFFNYLRLEVNHLFTQLQSLFGSQNISSASLQAQEQWDIIRQSTRVLYERQKDWFINLPESVYDPIALNLTWGIAVWLITIWIYRHVFNQKYVILGFLPSLIIIAGATSTVDAGLVWLFLILGLGISLHVLSNQAALEDYWQKKRYNPSELIRRRTVKYAVSLAFSLVFFAGLITSPKLDDFIDTIRERRQQAGGQSQGQGTTGNNNHDIFEEDNTSGPEEVLDNTADGWLPNAHLIGSGPELAETEVFYAQVQGSNGGLASRYYFRSATYETFTLRGWQNIDKDYLLIPPEEEFEIDFTPNEQLIYQEVTLLNDRPKGNLILVAGELTATNVSYYGSYHTKFINNTYTDLFAAVTDATQYQAYSTVPNFGENDLRNASQEYPTWITNKYLQIPDSIPDRVQELAFELTATQPTPYDRVLAIESYLRGFEYTLDVEAPPRTRDIVDYFLFDLQKGYCDYYASAMVILSRAAGIPTRLATGYLAKTYDSEASQFVITADQAHSWVEVYFPDYGWVTFEPTGGQPALTREDERQIISENQAFDPQIEDQITDSSSRPSNLKPNNLFVLLGMAIMLITVILFTYHWIEQWWLMRMDQKLALQKIYSRLRRNSGKLKMRIAPNDTPLEFSNILESALVKLNNHNILHWLLKKTPGKVTFIIDICNQAAYSNRPLEDTIIRQTIQYWGTVRLQLIIARILVRLLPLQSSLKRIWFRLQQPA